MERWRSIDASGPEDARRLLAMCCGSSRWVEAMLSRRPFGSRDACLSAARDEWFALAADDWREAFSHHPRIGDREALARCFPAGGRLSAREQAGLATAGGDVLTALAEGNREYERRFGWIFIVCAAGKTAEEMLALLRERLANEPRQEIRVAAEEQATITELRLTAAIESG